MRHTLAVAVIVAAVFILYRVHENRVKLAAIEAAEKARAEQLQPKPRRVAVSRLIEPSYRELFSDLDLRAPGDLVPPLEITRERILDKKQHVEEGKQETYAAAIDLIKAMVSVAEVRTQHLQSLLEANARPVASLDSRTSTSSSVDFFSQGVAKRWDTERQRRKPAVDQLFARLRDRERSWNKNVAETAPFESYDLPALARLNVTIGPALSSPNRLERGAYDHRQVVFPWRSAYYTQYGYRY